MSQVPLAGFLELVAKHDGPVAIDFETVGINPKTSSPCDGAGRVKVGSAAFMAGGESVVGGTIVPNTTSTVFMDSDLKALKNAIRDKTIVGHNLYGFDFPVLHNHGFSFTGSKVHDTLAFARLLYCGTDEAIGLKPLAMKLCGIEMRDFREVFRAPQLKKDGTLSKPREVPLSDIDEKHPLWPKLIAYAALDAEATISVYAKLLPMMSEEARGGKTFLDLYEAIWGPLYEELLSMSLKGLQIDVERCATSAMVVAEDQEAHVRSLKDWLHSTGNLAVNPRSPQQLQHLLYGSDSRYVGKTGRVFIKGLGMKPSPVCSKGPVKAGKLSTDAVALNWLLQRYPEHDSGISAILGIRTCESSKKYLTKLARLARDQGGRVHPTMAPSTSTGRLAVSKPEMQQIPKSGEKDPYGVRKCIVAAPGHKLIALDYSQLEMRVLAHIAESVFGDASIKEGVLADDVHSVTACRIFGKLDPDTWRGVEPHQVKKHVNPAVSQGREAVKAVAYGIMYGKSAHGLGGSLRGADGKVIGKEKAQAIIDAYLDLNPALRKYMEWIVDFGRQKGYVPSILGRRRYMPDLNSSHNGKKKAAERAALNATIQSTAADIVTLAMLRLKKAGANIILQVHDELIFEEREDQQLEELAEKYKDIMRSPFAGTSLKFLCPLDVSGGIADDWDGAK